MPQDREEQMEAISREIFSQIRTSIVMKMRFLDMAVFRLKPFPTHLLFATDGDRLYYHPGWLMMRYREDSNCVIRDYMHVLLHCIFRHAFVNSLVDHDLWDLACDIAVEAMISEFQQPIMAVKAESRRKEVIAALQKNVHQLTAEKLYHYFQDHPPKPDWMKLFHADDHEIWYNRQEQESLQQQARQKDSRDQQQGDGGQQDQQQGGGDGQQDRQQGGDGQQDQQQGGGDGQQDQQQGGGDGQQDRQQGGGDQQGQQQGGSGGGQGQQDLQAPPSGGGSSGGQETAPESGRDGSSDISDEWRDISEHVQMDLESFAKEQGYQAGGMEQLLAAVNREKYNYEAFLKKFAVMGEVMKINDDEFDYIFYTYGLKLFENMPLIEPLEYKEVKRIRDFVIAIDTSGSTSGDLVNRFLTKTYNILESTESFFNKVNIYIIQCDAEIQEVVRITKKEEFEQYLRVMKIKGLGGTDFRPVFAYVDRLVREKAFANLKGLIYFTDGYGTFPERKPDYQTAFVFIQEEFNNLDVPPWAIKLILEKDEMEAEEGENW